MLMKKIIFVLSIVQLVALLMAVFADLVQNVGFAVLVWAANNFMLPISFLILVLVLFDAHSNKKNALAWGGLTILLGFIGAILYLKLTGKLKNYPNL